MNQQDPTHIQVFRQSAVFKALEDTLIQMMDQGELSAEAIQAITNHFDAVMVRHLVELSKSNNSMHRDSFRGNLLNYKSCDEVWQLTVKDAVFRGTDSAAGQQDGTPPPSAGGPGTPLTISCLQIVAVPVPPNFRPAN